MKTRALQICLLILFLVGCATETLTLESMLESAVPWDKVTKRDDGLNYAVNQEKTFTGYTFGYILTDQASFDKYKDGKLHGKLIGWYENGQKSKEIMFNDGKRNGKTIWWYENGQKMLETANKDGKKSGKFLTWDENGNKQFEESSYKDGKLHGKSILCKRRVIDTLLI